MKYTAKTRAVIACFVLTTCFTGFSARLAQLQIAKHDEYTRLAAQKHTAKQPIFARRGRILDAHGEILADNEPLKTVVADGSLIAPHADEVAAAIADLLEIPEGQLSETLDTPRKYVIVKTQVPEAVALQITERLEQKKLRGIFFEQDYRRFYPNGEMLCHVLGCLSKDHTVVDGVERSMDDLLRGQAGFRYIERDRTGKELVPYRGQERQARDGCNVRLTVDMGLQSIVETELDAAYREYHPEVAVAIMMEPQTGRILAMANRPCYDPNHPVKQDGSMKNCAITNLVEPGSTFKIVTAAAVLNDKLVTPDTMINCEGGRFSYAGKVLHDHGHGDHPNLCVADVLVKSSNIGAAKLGMMLGDLRFYEYIRSFGFGEKTGVKLPSEISGMISPPHKWTKISIVQIPMGQGVAVTPLQMVAAMGAIANGGRLMMPQIVDTVLDCDGKPVVSYEPQMVRQVVDPKATEMVRAALKDVVSKRGTAARAAVPGFAVGGKTGTAQKTSAHGYYSDRYVTSFIGFMPVKDPRFVCLVLLDDPKASQENLYGGAIAGPVFSHIGERAARYLNMQPDPALLVPENAGVKLTKAER